MQTFPTSTIPARTGETSSWLMGSGPSRRLVKRLMLAVRATVVVSVLLWAAVLIGLAPSNQSAWAICYACGGQVVFYAMIRSGIATNRLKESWLWFSHALFCMSTLALGYGLIPFIRGTTLQLLILTLVFYMQALDPRQFGLAAAAAIGMLSLALCCVWLWYPQQTDLRKDTLTLLVSIALLLILATIGKAVRRIQLRQSAQKVELNSVLDRLHALAQHDGLTGTFNRRHMMTLLDAELKRQRRTGRPFCIAMLDIDLFKRINDTYGHGTGDEVLRKMSKMVGDALRQTDSLARWGGEEFLVLLPETAVAKATDIMNQIRTQVAQNDWSDYAQGLSVSFSCGICEHQASDGLGQSLEQADVAMYRAKAEGRNRVCVR